MFILEDDFMFRKTAVAVLCCMTAAGTFMFPSDFRTVFIKGNMADKTAAVREASGDDGIWLSVKALEFALEYKPMLGRDRELDGLAVAAVLSLPAEYMVSADASGKNELKSRLLELFSKFDDSDTVRIAVLSKIVSVRDGFPAGEFALMLDGYVSSADPDTADAGVFRSAVSTLGYIGDGASFSVLYALWKKNPDSPYTEDFEAAMTRLAAVSSDEISALIDNEDSASVARLFSLISSSSEISQKNRAEIAEKVLKKSILTADGSLTDKDTVDMQLSAVRVLSGSRWTRASSAGLEFFPLAEKEFHAGVMSEEQFIEVVAALGVIAPLDAVAPLSAYLGELNAAAELGDYASTGIMLAVINTLGAIGDKAAFDTLLAVSYLGYPEPVLSAARNALAGLKW